MRKSTKPLLEAAWTTIIGGAVFLVPLVVIVFFGSKLLGFLEGLLKPIEARTGELALGGVAFTTVLAIIIILLACYLVGLWGRTRHGHSVMQWAQKSIALVVPSFGMYNELLNEIGGEGANASVVMVPTDAGWTLAISFEEQADGSRLVFIPGAPAWTEGSIALAPPENIRPTDLTVSEMIGLLRHCGRPSDATAKLVGRAGNGAEH
ncbi:MAG TPA: hypothetical protein VFV70_06080 [Hyphomonadaceae bacterium]|nr:hypothetical protein [Hyphomonadaceae bacterium]